MDRFAPRAVLHDLQLLGDSEAAEVRAVQVRRLERPARGGEAFRQGAGLVRLRRGGEAMQIQGANHATKEA